MTDDTTMTLPAVGQPAPDFTLPDDTGTMRTLSAERGHWLVLYFYPKDDTPGCTTESCQFRDAHELYQQSGAEVWGISVLGSGSKAAFKAKFGLPFTLIADEQHAVAERYGVWVDKVNYGRTFKGIAPGDVPHRSRRAASPGSGPRSSPMATPRRSWRPSTSSPAPHDAPPLDGHGVRHRSWGETSDASARKVADVRRRHPQACKRSHRA